MILIKTITRNVTRTLSKMGSLETAKKLAAYRAVDDALQKSPGTYSIGIGSGSTIVYAVERLSQKVKEDNSLSVVCVPSSFQSRQLILRSGLKLSDLETNWNLDFCIDGADEIDSNLSLIKGGGGCLLQEKIIASCTQNLIIIADYTKDSARLGDRYKKGIPIEVLPLSYVPVMNKIKKRFGGDLYLRTAVAKAGPCITDNGNFILDWINFNQEFNWDEINKQLIAIPGIIETGLFVKMTKKAYIGLEDGTVKVLEA